MLTTFNVRVWKTTVYKGTRVTTYYVRWGVDGHPFTQSFRNKAQAESFRASLVAATSNGEAFYVASGLPVSMQRTNENRSWYLFACEYVDAKWPKAAAITRRTIAEALTAVTCLMFINERGVPHGVHLRSALKRWAGNHTRPVSAFADTVVLRNVLDGLAVRLDGSPRAPSVVARWPKILNNAVEYAIERKILAVNPIPALKWTPPRPTQVVDRRCVANPSQARALLSAVRKLAPHLVAFYGCLYFAALRPEEAAGLAKANLALPAMGWGRTSPRTSQAARRWRVDRFRSSPRRSTAQATRRGRDSRRTLPTRTYGHAP